MRVNIWSYTWCRDMHGRQPFFLVQERTILERPGWSLPDLRDRPRLAVERACTTSARARERTSKGERREIEMADWPKIIRRKVTKVSPWVEIMQREVEFFPGGEAQVYHSVKTADYVMVLAKTPDGRIPLVSQYRPALEAFTLELPAGLMNENEHSFEAASRELLEEAGFPTRTAHALGVCASDSGRLSNRSHSIFIETGEQISGFLPEKGMSLSLVQPSELVALIFDSRLGVQLHLGTLLQAALHGYLSLGGD